MRPDLHGSPTRGVPKLLSRLFLFREVRLLLYRHSDVLQPRTSVTIRGVTLDNVRDGVAMDSPERIDEFRGFLARGDSGWYAYCEDRVVHRSWVRRGPGEAALWGRFGRFRLAKGQAYIHYCETAPDARGRNIYPAVLAHAVDSLRQTGETTVFITTDEDNVASRHGIEKAGFREVRRLRFWIVFGIQIGKASYSHSSRDLGAASIRDGISN